MNFLVGLCVVILVAATSAERGDLKIYGSNSDEAGFLLLNDGHTFLDACFADQSFGSIEGLISCRQLGFKRHVQTGNGQSDKKTAVALLGNSSCTEKDTKLIDCMDVKFMKITDLPQNFVCKNRQLVCSNESVNVTPHWYPSEVLAPSYPSEALMTTYPSEVMKKGHTSKSTAMVSSKHNDKGSTVDTNKKSKKGDIGRYNGGSIICSARVMAVFTVIAVVWNVLYG